MAKPKGLHTVIRLQKWQVDELRRELGLRFAELQAIEKAAADLEIQLVEEQRIARESPNEAAFAYGRFASFVIMKREEYKKLIAAKNVEIDQAQAKVAEAFRTLKTYEKAQELRDKAEAEERNRKERNFLDEIGQQRYRDRLKDRET